MHDYEWWQASISTSCLNIKTFRYLSGLSHKTVCSLKALHLYLWHHALALCMRLDNYLHGWFCAIWSVSTYSRFLPLICLCLSPSTYQFTNAYVLHCKYCYSLLFLRFCEGSLVLLIKCLNLMLRYEDSTIRFLYVSCLLSTSLKPIFWLYLASIMTKATTPDALSLTSIMIALKVMQSSKTSAWPYLVS